MLASVRQGFDWLPGGTPPVLGMMMAWSESTSQNLEILQGIMNADAIHGVPTAGL
jgi:hypothetical protein